MEIIKIINPDIIPEEVQYNAIRLRILRPEYQTDRCKYMHGDEWI